MTFLEADGNFVPTPETTEFDDRVYSFVKSEIMRSCVCPSVREIKDALNAQSTSTVQRSINRLVKAGMLAHTPHKTRSLRIPSSRIILLDSRGKNAGITTWAAFNYDLPAFAQYVDSLTTLLGALEMRFGTKGKTDE